MATAAAIGLGAWALVGLAASLEPDAGRRIQDVEVPVTGPATTDAATATPVRSFQRPEVRCEPDGCSRWTVQVGHGRTAMIGDDLYHLGRHALTSLDPRDGTVRWRSSLPGPGASLLGMDVFDPPDDGPLLLVSDEPSLHGWDRATGRELWAVPWSSGAEVVTTGSHDPVLLLTVSGSLPDFDRADGEERAVELAVIGLDAASGTVRWSREVDDVVRLTPHLVLHHDDVLAGVDPATGEDRWRHPALAAGADPSGSEVAAAGVGGVTVLDPQTGAVQARVRADLTDALVRRPARHPVFDPATGFRLELHDGLVVVGAIREDTQGHRLAHEWEVVLYDRATGEPAYRYERATTWSRGADDPMLVLTAADEEGTLRAVTTSGPIEELWATVLPRPAATSWIEAHGDAALVAVSAARTEVEVIRLDPDTGEDLGHYGGTGWEPVGAGILGNDVSRPRPGSARALGLAGPDGVVTFSRRVRVVSTDPTIVAYWDTLIRIDDRLLVTGPPPRRTPNTGPR